MYNCVYIYTYGRTYRYNIYEQVYIIDIYIYICAYIYSNDICIYIYLDIYGERCI